MKLTLVTPTFAPEPLGTPVYATDMARWFAGSGWSPTIVTGQPYYPDFRRYPGYGRSTREDRVHDLDVRRLATVVPRAGRPLLRAASDLNFALQGVWTTMRGRVPPPDAVVTISPGSIGALMTGAKIARHGDAPHFVVVHDVMSGLANALHMLRSPALNRMAATLEVRSLATATRLFVLSKQMADVLEAMGVTQSIEILPLWSTIGPQKKSPSRATDVQFSGNFGRKQGIDLLLGLIAKVSEQRPGTTWTVRGAGVGKPLVEQASLDRRLCITLETPVPDAELASALTASPIHVITQHPGVGEYVLPSKAINALALGRVIVALVPSSSPLVDISKQCEGVVAISSGNLHEAASNIGSLLHEPSELRRRSYAAKQYASRHFDRSTILRTFDDIIRSECAVSAERSRRT